MDQKVFLTHQQIKALNLNIQLACDKLQLVERIRINKQAHPLEWAECLSLCYASKKLYNTGLYQFNQQYKHNQTFLTYEALAKQLKTDLNYQKLLAKVSQQTLKLLSQNIRSFLALKTLKANEKINSPKPPKYYKKGQLAPVIYTNQAVSKKMFNQQGLIQLSQTHLFLKSGIIKQFDQINCVRIVPSKQLKNSTQLKGNQQLIKGHFQLLAEKENNFEKLAELEKNYLVQLYDEDFWIEIVYTSQISSKRLANQTIKLIEDKIVTSVVDKKTQQEKQKETIVQHLEGNFNHFAAIDINLNALAIATQEKSFLYSLKPLKSKNHFWNKKCAKIQSQIQLLENEINHLLSPIYESVLQFNIAYHSTFLTQESLTDFITYKKQEKDSRIEQIKIQIKKLKIKRKNVHLIEMDTLIILFINYLNKLSQTSIS